MKDIIEKDIKKNKNVESIECVSRLLKRNMVFKVIIEGKPYAFKVYLKEDNFDRQKREEYLYNYFKVHNTINVPNINNTINCDFGPIMIIDWIDGISIKEEMKQGLPYKDIQFMLLDMYKIWNLNINDFPFLKKDKLGIDSRLFNDLNNIKKIIKDNKANIDFNLLFNYYDELYNSIEPNFDRVINSDISAHEYIISNNKGYWIDFERFCIGDPNNDLARSFMSLTNAIIDRTKDVEEIYKLFQDFPYFDKNIFIYYLIEKLMCSIYDAPLQITDNEIIFYISFIKEKLLIKNKQLLK